MHAGPDQAAATTDTKVLALLAPIARLGWKTTSYIGIGTGTHAKDKQSDQTRMGLAAFTSLMHRAYDCGIRFIDTADSYGTHEMIAQALKGRIREELYLQTKTMATTAAGIRADADRFRRELDTDYIDSLLLHCMENTHWPREMEGASDELRKLKEEGVVGQIGVSIHGLAPLVSAVAVSWTDICMVRFNPMGLKMDAGPAAVMDLINQMKAKEKVVIGMKIFAAGNSPPDVCRESLKWVRERNLFNAVVLGLTTTEQIDEAVSVAHRHSA